MPHVRIRSSRNLSTAASQICFTYILDPNYSSCKGEPDVLHLQYQGSKDLASRRSQICFMYLLGLQESRYRKELDMLHACIVGKCKSN